MGGALQQRFADLQKAVNALPKDDALQLSDTSRTTECAPGCKPITACCWSMQACRLDRKALITSGQLLCARAKAGSSDRAAICQHALLLACLNMTFLPPHGMG